MKYTPSALVENQPGVLSRASGLFSRRTFNIDSLAMGVTEDPTILHMTIVVNGDEHVMEQVEKQLNKLIPVIRVERLDDTGPFTSCELVLIKASCTPQYRPETIQVVELFHVCVVDISPTLLMIQLTDTVKKTETMLTLLKSYGTKEIARTDTVALEQGPQVTREQSV